jgi:hypothetical protein
MIMNQSILFHMSKDLIADDHKLSFDWLNKKQILHIMTVQDSEILICYQTLISEY